MKPSSAVKPKTGISGSVVVLAGLLLLLRGRDHLIALAFPLTFAFFMVPLPAIVINAIAFPLQLFASRFGVAAMQLCQVPALREGNVIVLADTTLEVAEACSGIRSLVSLLTLGIVCGYFSDMKQGNITRSPRSKV